jgi:hypothetical protein
MQIIADTGTQSSCVDYYIPFDSGTGVSPDCLCQFSTIEISGYTVNNFGCANPGQIQVALAQDSSTRSSERPFIWNSGPVPQPVQLVTAAAEFCMAKLTANGLYISNSGLCSCNLEVANLVITFKP